jgi:solute carrier family 25 phosphate transporter 3
LWFCGDGGSHFNQEQLSTSTVTSINLGSGLIAGICAAIISQPADTLLSKINKQKVHFHIVNRVLTARALKEASRLV